MKKSMIAIATSFALTTAAITPAHADALTEAKQVGAFTASAVVGVTAGGPIGMIAGGLTGAWLSKQIEDAAEAEQLNEALADKNHTVTQLNQQLVQAQAATQAAADLLMDELQLQMLFTTGSSDLDEKAIARLETLADYLANSEHIEIYLEGYADPRGDADYNLALSEDRVASVVEVLTARGVEAHRILHISYGAAQSQALTGGSDSYALERVVKINLHKVDTPSVATR